MSDAFGKALGQTVVVDNKPGNGSSIAAHRLPCLARQRCLDGRLLHGADGRVVDLG